MEEQVGEPQREAIDDDDVLTGEGGEGGTKVERLFDRGELVTSLASMA